MIETEILREHNSSEPEAIYGLLAAQAESLTQGLRLLPGTFGKRAARAYWLEIKQQKQALLGQAERPLADSPFDTRPPDLRDQLLRENWRLLASVFKEAADARASFAELPQALVESGEAKPRIFLVTERYLSVTEDCWNAGTWTAFLTAVERHETLQVREIWGSVASLKVMVLKRLCHWSDAPSETNQQENAGSAFRKMQACIRSLEQLGQVDWSRLLEPLVPFDRILRQDPAGAYGQMEMASRQMYHAKIEELGRRSDLSETQIAQMAIDMAKEKTHPDQAGERSNPRETHVGYYLLDDGAAELAHRVGYHPSITGRIRSTIRKYPNEFYIGGVEVVTAVLIAAVLVPHISARSSMTADLFALVLMILPASQSAVDLFNNLVARIFNPASLAKMDYRYGVPPEFTTLVAVPALLLNEKQIAALVEDVEIRYLANQDRNIHFALLTDLADSVHRPEPNDSSPLVDLAVKLIEDLNERYRAGGKGIIFLMHRHRVFNQRQQVWMGWERKRGKLLDLNKLICEGEDAFPVKSSTLPELRNIRYVITLDSDTQLPRGAAHRLIGTMAHPLNRPVIDGKRHIVAKGFGILQPRVDISVHSANHSRLAALQSGETGMDPYSRAVSDVYQDLYGEAIFTGKGLYDVAVLHAVLNKRFPRNSLLSHDLIEGAYARVGLVSDVEVVDDYPSHYSAWSRRRHRWVRGDWQTVQWLFGRVPNELGKYVRNPISLTSRWRILDNLRRSLVEIATLCLLLAGWIGLPGGALYWTLATLALLFLPVYVQLLFSLVPALLALKFRAARRALADCRDAHALTLLTLIFLPSQVLITIDAIFRATFRRFVSGQRLLEWETAAQSEMKSGGTPVDRYIRVMPIVTALLAVALYFDNHTTFAIASPVLVLWALTSPFVHWLNAKPVAKDYQPDAEQVLFLRNVALRMWRYFAEFSTAENHWLIPDNVQEQDQRRAERVSPTNVGLLLNARQTALEFGYLTCPEFVRLTLDTLATLDRLPKHRGHLLNWYNTQTLEVLQPPLVTSVDSGNLVASLISLRMGSGELLTSPMVPRELLAGLRDHLQVLESLGAPWPGRIIPLEDDAASDDVRVDAGANGAWLDRLLRLDPSLQLVPEDDANADVRWWARQTQQRFDAIRTYIEHYLPWQMPEYESLRQTALREIAAEMVEVTPLRALPLLEDIRRRLHTARIAASPDDPAQQVYARLLEAMDSAQWRLGELLEELRHIDAQSRRLVQETDFTFLLNPERELLSIGYRTDEQKLAPSCFDLLASEARIAVFIAIAKGDIPQQTWFRLGRAHVKAAGRSLLLSWTGTMFEYLMPTLWMRNYPDTMLSRSLSAVVQVQRWAAQRYRIPWGFSESGYSDTDAEGNYQYHAFGVPEVALQYGAEAGPIVSPYSSCLALEIDPEAALANLKQMQKLGWLGSYGFYEAGDYRAASASRRQPTSSLVRSWMAHHQGMSLMAVCNLLRERVFQRWFHRSPMVQSTERLLYERAPAYEATAQD